MTSLVIGCRIVTLLERANIYLVTSSLHDKNCQLVRAVLSAVDVLVLNKKFLVVQSGRAHTTEGFTDVMQGQHRNGIHLIHVQAVWRRNTVDRAGKGSSTADDTAWPSST